MKRKHEKESFYDGYDTPWNEGEDEEPLDEEDYDLNQSLYHAMLPEIYKGIRLQNVLGRWAYGMKSFETKEELKKFIDTL